MTLRARLTAAFLAVVLGPVLLGAVFVGVTVTTVGHARSLEQLEIAAVGVRTAAGATCQRLHSAATTAALLGGDLRELTGTSLSAGRSAPGASGNLSSDAAGPVRQVVESELASSVILATATGEESFIAGTPPPGPWAICFAGAQTGGVAAGPHWQSSQEYERRPFAGLSARVDVRDSSGGLVGYATAVDAVDGPFVAKLADAGGAAVSIVDGGPARSTERDTEVSSVMNTARSLSVGKSGRASNGRYVRRLDPEEGQPLTLALSVPAQENQGRLYAVLVAVVVAAALGSVGAAWGLARSTARPLTELAAAVDRVAAGDLAARVPVRLPDEVGRLGATFNRMTRETQGYVQALTASRDQLRRQLGVLGDTLSSTHDLNRILRVILQTASAATGAQAGIVLLADSTTGILVGQCSTGLDERGAPTEISDLRLRMGEGLLGWVAANGEPRRGRVDRDGPLLAFGEPRCLTYVAVPLMAPTAGPTTGLEPICDLVGGATARGVLALYDRHGFDEFDDSDLVILRTFAGQVAVALDNVRVHEEAQRLSLTDALTGLSNYRYLRESLRREIERASRFGHPLAVLVLDLDHFKEINDTYGHAAGDAVLAEFARRVRAEIREVDLAFRQGGEEFVVLLPETDVQGAEVVALRLGEIISRNPVLVVSHQATRPLRISVTVSVGAAVYPADGDSGLAVLEAADDALYAAKAAGRNTFRLAGQASG
ncbi:MAG: diguanylate cyclase [Micromonosporaceae bacterium]|nr:diguanylate cyclase [Micromonosporaceae bacterium]